MRFTEKQRYRASALLLRPYTQRHLAASAAFFACPGLSEVSRRR